MAGNSEPQGDVSDTSTLDPESLGFMCGIEVHQQLATGKLHSRQKGELYDVSIDTLPEDWPRYSRRLTPARGEGGKIDVAAKFEAKRNRSFVYVMSPNSGLIELDERPPLPHDKDAMDISLTVSAMLNAKPLDLMQTMRKTVVDGSNTTGFQRTTLISRDGILEVEGGDVRIDVLCLEEDSARKLDTITKQESVEVIYNLDRLGLPLIEIATAPDIKSPSHAKDTAIALGRTLRDTRRVRRGLGSIRQDLNVSIACGDRVEIKGCQDLSWIPRIIELEMARQLHFYRLANELRSEMGLPTLPNNRDDDDSEIEQSVAQEVSKKLPLNINDVSDLFSSCESKMVTSSLDSGGVMLALVLPGLAGKIGTKVLDSQGSQMPRLGRELAGAAKLAGVKGIFHSDELPAYGITQDYVDVVRENLSLNKQDAFLLCCAPKWQAELALESSLNRARMAWHRSPKEVRNVVIKKGAPEDGTTSPMRPLPGGARMYPETDIPNFELTESKWKEVLDNLPMSQAERKSRLESEEMSEDQAKQLLSKQLDDLYFEFKADLPAKAWASILMDNEGQNPQFLADVLQTKEQGFVSRDGMNTLISEFSNKTYSMESMAAWAEENGLKPADASDLESVVKSVVESRLDFVKERGMGAMGPLMGLVMKEAKGADGKQVSDLLRKQIMQHQ
ncbi:MAG: Glu-tRNA(Gln) amidotransferase subunit GatE [Candidatus Poseidoniaceae archaeon]